MAKQYGITPWGKWFIEALGSYKIDERLHRGKSYANTDKVLALTIKDRTVSAKVKGNSMPFYLVTISFPELKEKDTVISIIENNPMLLSRISKGELPPELITEIKKANITLVPKDWISMKRSCNCPDWGDPCKHMAAVYYVLALEIDADPTLMFKLRGIDLAEIFSLSKSKEIHAPFTIEYANAEEKAQDISIKDAYTNPSFGTYTNFIQALLPNTNAFTARDFSIILNQFYHHFALHDYNSETSWNTEHEWSNAKLLLKTKKPSIENTIKLIKKTPGTEDEKLSLVSAYKLFLSFSSDAGSSEYSFLFYFFRLVHAISKAFAFVPFPHVVNNSLGIFYTPILCAPEINTALQNISAFLPPSLQFEENDKKATKRSCINLLSTTFFTELVKEQGFKIPGINSEIKELVDMFFNGQYLSVSSPKCKNIPYAIESWLSVFSLDFNAYKYRFTLKENDTKNDTEDDSKNKDTQKQFLLKLSVLQDGKELPFKTVASDKNNIEVLKAPTALSAYLPEIVELTERRAIALSTDRLINFLDDASKLLRRLGVEVILPKSLHKELRPKLVIHAESKKSGSLVSYLTLDSMLNYEWKISLGDNVISLSEFNKLVAEKNALVHFHDGYVKLDPYETAKLLKLAKKMPAPSNLEILKARFSGDAVLSVDAEEVMSNLFSEKNCTLPHNLQANLRPYQESGYKWLYSLLVSGFGCILADDMGLGKTVQAIAALTKLNEDGLLPNGTLIVAPAALLANWERELKKFSPELKVKLYHGAKRAITKKADVFLTTYQTTVKDSEALINNNFSLLIVDEAHLMKNANTKTSIAVKSLNTQYKIALSGTPVENRLEDLRSLFDFVLPGYLGSAKTFKDNFRTPIEVDRNVEKAELLKKITQPFLLRRLKTDKSIISDLPEKIIINEYANLEKEQAALYQNLIQNGLKESEKAEEPFQRSAIILKLLTGLKQICNHPRVYDKESESRSDLSGKCILLLTLLEEILRNREKVLIFSQYVETLETLKTIITTELKESCILYHGGMNQDKRNAAVELFQTDASKSIMLISLKAGGLGLNLTEASRVIHFDLWYNPAVENQATDRAFRIGQKRNVFVHRFITTGTFEEKIDAMLSSKSEIANMSISEGESWLCKMSHDELKDLFKV